MKKFVSISTVIISVIIIILSVYYFITGNTLPGVQPLLLSVLMVLLAYNHVQLAKERQSKKLNAVLFIFINAGVLNLAVAVMQIFF